MDQTQQLKNGTIEHLGMVRGTVAILTFLRKKNPMLFDELVKKCKDPNYTMLGNTQEMATNLKLMDQGIVCNSNRNIILSALEGCDSNLTLVSPVATNTPRPASP